MNCDDIDNAIYVYLDDELADHDEADFDAHLLACPRCHATVARETALMTRIRADAPSVPAPPELRARIVSAIDRAPAPDPPPATTAPRPRSMTRWAAPLAAAAALTAIVWATSSGGDASVDTERVVTESVETHRHDLPMEVRGSERQIRTFLEETVPFAIDLPFDDDLGVRLVGARLTRVDGLPAVLLNYELDGERMSVIQVAEPGARAAPDVAPNFERRHGFEITTFRRGGVTTSVVGQGQHVRRLVRTRYAP